MNSKVHQQNGFSYVVYLWLVCLYLWLGLRVPTEVLFPGDLQWADLWLDGTVHYDPAPSGEHEERCLCGSPDWDLSVLCPGSLWGQSAGIMSKTDFIYSIFSQTVHQEGKFIEKGLVVVLVLNRFIIFVKQNVIFSAKICLSYFILCWCGWFERN